MCDHIIIQRAGFVLWGKSEPDTYTKHRRSIQVPSTHAKIISPRLALYKHEKGTTWSPTRYHVIHISTGFVIADVEYADVKHVKKTFEESKWTLENGNTFVLLYEKIQWKFTCLIRYDVAECTESLTES